MGLHKLQAGARPRHQRGPQHSRARLRASCRGNPGPLGPGGINIASMVGLGCSYWTSAATKMAAAAPLALAGAVVGAALHQLRGTPAERDGNISPRGERNDETFAFMKPTTSIPEAYFFLSEDGFGLDVRELAQFASARGSLINPHTNTAFSSQDVMRLQAALPWALGAGAPVMMGELSLLSKQLWVKYFDTFVGLAASLGQSGSENAHHRALGREGGRQLLTSGDPIEARELNLFVETMMDAPWATILHEIDNDPSAAQHFAAMLLKMCCTVGSVALGVSAQAASVAEFTSSF